jgi:ketosteroid isomerase-like protein
MPGTPAPEEGDVSDERRQQLLTRAIEGMNSGDLDAYGAMFAEDVLVYGPGSTEPARGRAARVGWVADLLTAFPNGAVVVRGTFYAGARGCVEFAFDGTHTGPLKGAGGVVPPTGARVSFPYCITYVFDDDDLATEVREYFDQLELLGPLGLLTPAGS